MGYPTKDLKDYYLVVEIKLVDLSLFGNSEWRFKDLKGYMKVIEKEKNIYRQPGIPFTTTLSELMQNRVK